MARGAVTGVGVRVEELRVPDPYLRIPDRRRIRTEEPSNRRVVEPGAEVVEPSFLLPLLAGEAVGLSGALEPLAPGAVVQLGDELAVLAGLQGDAAEVILVVVDGWNGSGASVRSSAAGDGEREK